MRRCEWISDGVRCEATVKRASSYCPEHHRRVYMAPEEPVEESHYRDWVLDRLDGNALRKRPISTEGRAEPVDAFIKSHRA